MFHIPTFMKNYEEFWANHDKFSLSWVGLLFIMISHAAFFCKAANEAVPGDMGTADYVMEMYRRVSAQCLALDDFTTPGKYKVEAMILYFGIEYLRRPDAQRSTSILMSIIVRLAMHSGLHREPDRYNKGISVFEGEMRRRLWTVLTEIDVLVSFQFGLAGNVQRQFFDTQIPHNLLDEDFDESTTELPPERPFTERTPALYTIVKSRLVVAFCDILSKMTSRSSPSYGEVLRLDGRLEDAHKSIPPILRARSFASSVADPVELLMQRLWIELMYQKARIVLHRRYFSLAHADSRYERSYEECIQASMTLLQYQFDIYNEMQPGGRLAKEQWFMSSLSTHDFLLADMILCLELSHLLKKGKPRGDEAADREKLRHIIGASRNIWKVSCEKNPEAMRAFKILSRMLSLAGGTSYDATPDTPIQIEEAAADLTQKPSYQFSPRTPLRELETQQFQQLQQQQQQQQTMVEMVQMGMGPWAVPPMANLTTVTAAGVAPQMAMPTMATGPLPMNMTWTNPAETMAYQVDQPLDIGHGFDWVRTLAGTIGFLSANAATRPTGTPKLSMPLRLRAWRHSGTISSTIKSKGHRVSYDFCICRVQ